MGCAIAYPQAKACYAAGMAVDVIAGFRSKDIVILEEEFRAVCDHLYITTDDGSYMEKGFVTDKLKALIEAGNQYDVVIAIGPVPMMKFVCKTTEPYGIKTIVSLNPIMIDGTGMCGGCRVTVGGRMKFACVDGPDFDGHQVDFDELMSRNAVYKGEEAEEEARHACRMEQLAEELIHERGVLEMANMSMTKVPVPEQDPQARSTTLRRSAWAIRKSRPWRRPSAACTARTSPAWRGAR